MSKVQWLGSVAPSGPTRRMEVVARMPVNVPVLSSPSTTEQFLGAVEDMIATMGGPTVRREYESLGDAAQGNVSSWSVTWGILSALGVALAAYHGYKRNHESTGAAVGWGVLGGLFPVITVPVALAQGYGKPRGSSASENPRDFAEVGKSEHGGVTYEAGGAFYDAASGTLVGYVRDLGEGRYWLTRWDGGTIAPLRLVSKHRGGFGRGMSRGTIYAWSATYDGRVFSGRNSGTEMLLRMRAGRRTK